MGGYVDWDLEGLRGAEEFGCGIYSRDMFSWGRKGKEVGVHFGEFVDGMAEFLLEVADTVVFRELVREIGREEKEGGGAYKRAGLSGGGGGGLVS